MDITQARKMARIKASDAAPVWGLEPLYLALCCRRGNVPGAKKLGPVWYVTPTGMDQLFECSKKR